MSMTECGTHSGYTAGCRCDACRAAKARYVRRYRAKNSKPKPKPKPSDEQIEEAWERWATLKPVADAELDALLTWAATVTGERDSDRPEAHRRKTGSALTEWERVTIRLLLSGRTGRGQMYQSPPDGLLAQRWRETTGNT